MKNLDALKKRNILFGATKMAPEKLIKFAQQMESQGHLSDAADFFDKAAAREELKRLCQKVVAEGDAFMFLKITRMLTEENMNQALLKQCAETAERLGKSRYAMMAYSRLGLEDDVNRLKDTLKDDGDILAESEQAEQVFIPEHSEEISNDEDF